MRVAILQAAPTLGAPAANIARADALLAAAGLGEDSVSSDASDGASNGASASARPGPIDMLVLPEMAFSGYNFASAAHIAPFLEPTAAGPSARWAARTAARLHCLVTVGYPEVAAADGGVPRYVSRGEVGGGAPASLPAPDAASAGRGTAAATGSASPLASADPSTAASPPATCYNACITVGPDGAVLAHARKTHLYYTDATWAQPAPDGFVAARLPLDLTPHARYSSKASGGAGSEAGTEAGPGTDGPAAAAPAPPAITTQTAFAICMDINPRFFAAPWGAYEAARHVLASGARLLVACNAWVTTAAPDDLAATPREPDLDALAYWIERFTPLLQRGVDGDGEESGAGDGIGMGMGIGVVEADSGNTVGGGADGTASGGNRSADTAASTADSAVETLVVVANRCGTEPGDCRACELDPERRVPRHSRPDPQVGREQGVAQRPDTLDGESSLTTGAIGEPNNHDLKGDDPDSQKLDPSLIIELAAGWPPGEGPVFCSEARYAGTSCVMAIGGGRARVLGMLGKAEEGVLVVDTDREPISVFGLAKKGGDDRA